MKKITLLLLAMLFLIAIPASAQTITLGTYDGAGSTNVLLSTSTTSNRYSRTISIYTDTDILTAGGTAGVISKLAWDKSGSGEYTTNDAYIKIYLKHITNDIWTVSPDWNTEIVGATEVFTSSTYSIPTGTGWVEVPFTNNFTWNGTDNIAVMVEWDRSSKPSASINWGFSNSPDANAAKVGSASLAGLGTFHINDKLPLLQLTFGAASSCAAPNNLTLVNAGTNSAEISWDASPDETGGYDWEVYYAGDDQGIDPSVATGAVNTGNTTVTISGLSDNTAYDFYVKTNCASDSSIFAGPLTFTTIEDCVPPYTVQVDDVTETTATFSWTASPTEVNGYEWKIYNEGDDPDTANVLTDGNVASGVTTVEVTSLGSDTSYDFYIRTLCANVFSEFEGPINFKTDKELNVSNNKIDGLTLYPNPVDNVLKVSAKSALDKIEIFTINGQKVKEVNPDQKSINIDISSFPQGLYFVKTSLGEAISNFKIIKR